MGDAGHAAALLAASGPEARLLGIDLDQGALQEAARVLEPWRTQGTLVHGTFADIERLAREKGVDRATGILFDLGLRSAQLESALGFSFRGSTALDMRFDASGTVALPEPSHQGLRRLARARGAFTAADVLRFLTASELEGLLSEYGGERRARRIAEAIVTVRRRQAIATASDLVAVVVRSLPPKARHGRIHVATRTFQALRIAVNREFESLALGLQGALRLLAEGGRLAVVSYHSGEDRIVKYCFRAAAATGAYAILTKTPVSPTGNELEENPRSRSAKLRILRSTESSSKYQTHQPHDTS